LERSDPAPAEVNPHHSAAGWDRGRFAPMPRGDRRRAAITDAWETSHQGGEPPPRPVRGSRPAL